jgi:hypothetical protein
VRCVSIPLLFPHLISSFDLFLVYHHHPNSMMHQANPPLLQKQTIQPNSIHLSHPNPPPSPGARKVNAQTRANSQQVPQVVGSSSTRRLASSPNANAPSSDRKKCKEIHVPGIGRNVKVNARSSSSLHTKLFARHPFSFSSQSSLLNRLVTKPCHTFNAASLAFTLANTSGSGAGSTLDGAARGQDTHFGCWHRTHSLGGALAAAFPSSESGCAMGGKTLPHLWHAYFTGLEMSSEWASPG